MSWRMCSFCLSSFSNKNSKNSKKCGNETTKGLFESVTYTIQGFVWYEFAVYFCLCMYTVQWDATEAEKGPFSFFRLCLN